MQSRTHSFIESLVNVALGMIISMALQVVVFPAGQRINVRDFPKSWDEHIDDAMKGTP